MLNGTFRKKLITNSHREIAIETSANPTAFGNAPTRKRQ